MSDAIAEQVSEGAANRILGRVKLLDGQAEDAAKEAREKLGFDYDLHSQERLSAQLHVFGLIVMHGIAAEWAHPLSCDTHHIYFLDENSRELSIRVWLCAEPDDDYSWVLDLGAYYTILVKHGDLSGVPCFCVTGYFKGNDRTLRPLTLQSPNIIFDTKAISSTRKRTGEAKKPAENKKKAKTATRKAAKKEVNDDPLGLF